MRLGWRPTILEVHERLELNNSPDYKLLCQHIRKILSEGPRMDQDGPDVKRGDSRDLNDDLNTCQDQDCLLAGMQVISVEVNFNSCRLSKILQNSSFHMKSKRQCPSSKM